MQAPWDNTMADGDEHSANAPEPGDTVRPDTDSTADSSGAGATEVPVGRPLVAAFKRLSDSLGTPAQPIAETEPSDRPTAVAADTDGDAESAGAEAEAQLPTAVGQDWVPETAGPNEDVAHQGGAIGEYVAASTRRFSGGTGRGLAALLGGADATTPQAQNAPTKDTSPQPVRVPIAHISPGAFQPRRKFDAQHLEELAQSMRKNGVLMPILVRRLVEEDRYEILAGERRWRAAQMAGLLEVPVTIRDLDDGQALEVALIENIQRHDLTPLEEAQGYRRLMDTFGHTQEALADVVGKSRSHVANLLRLLSLPPDVQDMLQDGRLSAGHGRALAAAQDPSALAETVVARQLNVRETEKLASRIGDEDVATTGGATSAPDMAATDSLARQLSQDLGLKVKIKRRGERGEMRIAFTSLDQFELLARRLRAPLSATTGDDV